MPAENITREEEVRSAVTKSLVDSGLGKRYAVPSMTLAAFGEVGMAISEGMNGPLLETLRKGIGVFIQGGGLRGYDLQMMTCRALLLKRMGVRVVSLSYLLGVLEGKDDYMEVNRAKALGIRAFYEKEFPLALTEENRLMLDLFFRKKIEDDIPLILQAAVAPTECVWWTRTLREMITDRTITFVLPTSKK